MICLTGDHVWRTAIVALVAGFILLQPGESSTAQVYMIRTKARCCSPSFRFAKPEFDYRFAGGKQ